MKDHLFLNLAICHSLAKDDFPVFLQYLAQLKTLSEDDVDSQRAFGVFTKPADAAKVKIDQEYFSFYRDNIFLMQQESRNSMNLALTTSL